MNTQVNHMANWCTPILQELTGYNFSLYQDNEKRVVLRCADFVVEWDCVTQLPHAFHYRPEIQTTQFPLSVKFSNLLIDTTDHAQMRTFYQQYALRLINEILRPFIDVYKLRSIVDYVDRSEQNEALLSYENELSSILEIDDFASHALWFAQTRLTGYWLQNWGCSSVWVGSAVYYLDGKPAFFVVKESSKSDAVIEFFTREMALAVREYLQTFLESRELKIPVLHNGVYVLSHYNVEYVSEIIRDDALLDGVLPVKIVRWTPETQPIDPSMRSTHVLIKRAEGDQISEETTIVKVSRLFFSTHLFGDVPAQPRLYNLSTKG